VRVRAHHVVRMLARTSGMYFPEVRERAGLNPEYVVEQVALIGTEVTV